MFLYVFYLLVSHDKIKEFFIHFKLYVQLINADIPRVENGTTETFVIVVSNNL